MFDSYQIQDTQKPQKYNFKSYFPILFKSYFPILFKSFFLRPEMVFNRPKLFYGFKNICENLGKLGRHILSIYKSFNTWSCSKYWSNPSKTLSGYFKLLKYLQRKYSPKIPRKFYHVTYDIFGDLAKSHVLENKITSPYTLKTISVHFGV